MKLRSLVRKELKHKDNLAKELRDYDTLVGFITM